MQTLDGGDAMIERLTHDDASLAPSPALDQYRSLFENAIEGIYRTTPDGRYLAANPALARVYGYDGPDALIAGLTDIARNLYVNPADRDRFKRALAVDSQVRNFEAQVFRKDGSSLIGSFVLSRCMGNFLARPQFIAWGPNPKNAAVRLIEAFGPMKVFWTARPDMDHAALTGEYDGVIFEHYAPPARY